MVKKAKLLLVTLAVFSMFTILGVTAFAADTAQIKVIAVDDDNTTASPAKVSGLTATIYSYDGTDVTSSFTLDTTTVSGEYLFKGITKKDTYTVKLASASGTESVSIPVIVTTLAATPTPKVATVTWLTSATVNKAKSGSIGGQAVDAAGTGVVSGAKVMAYNATGTKWETVSTATGYKLYVPTGKYTVVVQGKDTATDYKNLYTTVTVAAGQTVGPIDDLSALKTWATNEDKLGYTLSVCDTIEKKIAGTANAKTLVEAYTKAGSVYTLLGTAKVTAVGAATTGNFSIPLKAALPGGTVVELRVYDPAFNKYTDTVTLANRAMTLTPKTPTATTGTITTTVNLDYKDSATLSTTTAAAALTILSNNITTISAVGVTDGVTTTLNKVTKDFTASAGKIVIAKGKLKVAQNYQLTVKAAGYTDGTGTITVAKSLVAPPTAGTFTMAAGSVPGSTKVTAIGTAATAGKAYKYITTDSAVAMQNLNNPLVGGTALVTGTDITGVDIVKNKYVYIYRVLSAGDIIEAGTKVTLVAANVKPVLITSAYATGTTVKIVANAALGTTAPAASTFSVKIGTAAAAPSAVSISGKVITLTVPSTVTTTAAVTVTYTQTATTVNPLAASNGSVIATFTGKVVTNVNENADPETVVPVLSAVATAPSTTGTVSAKSSEGGVLYLVKKATYANPAALQAALDAGDGSAINCKKDTATLIPAAGLAAGAYSVYAVDWAGNMSVASADVTIN